MLEPPVSFFVKAEDRLVARDQDRPFDEIRLLHHQVDRFLLRRRQWTRLEYRAARADEVEEVVRLDVLLEKGPVGRLFVDVLLVDADPLLFQKTSGVAACRSGGFQVKGGLRHVLILQLSETC
jgi:hypothetical protein